MTRVSARDIHSNYLLYLSLKPSFFPRSSATRRRRLTRQLRDHQINQAGCPRFEKFVCFLTIELINSQNSGFAPRTSHMIQSPAPFRCYRDSALAGPQALGPHRGVQIANSIIRPTTSALFPTEQSLWDKSLIHSTTVHFPSDHRPFSP